MQRESFLEAVGYALSRPSFWGITLLATAPMVLKFAGMGEKWMFVYFSFFWAYVFFKVARVRPSLWQAGAFGYTFTGLFALPLLVGYISAPPHVTEIFVASQSGLARLGGFVLGVGVREEIAKVAAVAWMSRMTVGGRRVLASPVEAMVVGSLSGLGFAAVENMDYLERFQFLDKLHYTFGIYGDNYSFRGSMSRVMLTPFVHAVWAGIFSYFVFRAARSRGRARLRLGLAGLALAAGLHGLYDFFTSVAGGDAFVFACVAASFAVWLACYETEVNDRWGVFAEALRRDTPE